MATYAELQSSLDSADRAKRRALTLSADMQHRVTQGALVMGGGLAALATTFATGFVEQRVRTKDGSALSVGPVSLPAVVGMVTGTGAAVCAFAGLPVASGITAAVANAHVGLASGTLGRGVGLSRYQSKSADEPKKRVPKPKIVLAGELAGESAGSDEAILAALMRAGAAVEEDGAE